ncbi:DUF4132 domain-containing protein [Nocardia sp. NPDC127526]|uniref:DUF4132 domain-containing protein n=1 Tax=Nocardia sp. NPDC127526 TaxID=3345393 RepID=UPI003644673E
MTSEDEWLPPAGPRAKSPRLPRWLVTDQLPRIRRRDSGTTLPDSAAARVIAVLMTAAPDADHPGLTEVAAATDPASLADFTWAIFEAWGAGGYPAKCGWVLDSLARTGDDETVRRLVPFITAWPGKSASARAAAGLNVLAAIGGDIALMHLHSIAESSRFEGLRTRAREKVEEIARALNLSDEELADRIVPSFGLSAAGTATVNYGRRQFDIGLDHELRPRVSTEGTRLRTLPKPAAADDPELAPAAYRSFRDLAKELKTVTAEQVRRFESAMLDGRRWRASAHRTLVVEHPVLGQLARRLVWAVFDADGTATGSFRIDADGTLADTADEPFELPEDALVGVAHPLHLGDAVTRWQQVFSDYELLQPFEQLDRGVYRFTPAEAAADELARFADRTVPTRRLYGLRQRGWELSYGDISRPFGVLTRVRITLDPGLRGGYHYEAEEQHIVSVRINSSRFGVLDALAASELLRQLERLAA